LPDTWPNRTMYDRHAEAFFAAYAGQIAEVNARWSPEVGTPFFNGGASGNRAITYQLSFATPTFVVAQRCDVGGKLRDTVIANVARAQVGWVREPSFNFRNWMSGRSLAWSSEDNKVDAKTWA